MPIKRPLVLLLFCLLCFAMLFTVTSAGPDADALKDVKTGTVTGKILIKGGEPLAWGQIMFYDVSAGPPPVPDKYYRTPDISRDIKGDGTFKADLPPGRYYMGAVRRITGDRFGVPREGDHVFRSVDDKGKLKEYVVTPGSVTDVGAIAEAVLVKPQDISKRQITTAVEGIVTDTKGKPVEDAVVIAFTDPSARGKSLFLSDNTDKNGRYLLRVTEGTYYLRVRNRFTVGPPEAGQIVGFYGDGSLAPVRVHEGDVVKGINFTVILFGGRGPRPEAGAP